MYSISKIQVYYAESKLFQIVLEHSICVLLDYFDEYKNECSIRIQQLMHTVCYSITQKKVCDISLL